MMMGLAQPILLQACTSGLSSCLSSIYLPWFAFAGLVAVTAIAVLGLMYGLSEFVGRSDIKTWVRVKIYDVLFSLVLIFIFVGVAGTVYNFNVGGLASNNVDLVPQQCQSGSSAILGSGVDPTQNIFAMAICDMYAFNTYTSEMNTAQYYLTLALGALQPRFGLNFGLSPSVAGTALSVSLSVPGLTLLPADTAFKYLGTGVDLIYSFVLANDVQLILLSAAPLVFALLISLGLIARLFGVTRTFGGAMIAFGIGLGLLYPILVSIMYGFIDYGLTQVSTSAASTLATYGFVLVGTGIGLPLAGSIVTAGGFAAAPILGSGWVTALATFAASGGSLYTAIETLIPEPIFIFAGLVWVGLTFIPLIVLVIVDVFIIDFSQAIGERMDLMSMLIRIL
jgi:hypothetical protein